MKGELTDSLSAKQWAVAVGCVKSCKKLSALLRVRVKIIPEVVQGLIDYGDRGHPVASPPARFPLPPRVLDLA